SVSDRLSHSASRSLQHLRFTEQLIKARQRYLGNVNIGDVRRLLTALQKLFESLFVYNGLLPCRALQQQPQGIINARLPLFRRQLQDLQIAPVTAPRADFLQQVIDFAELASRKEMLAIPVAGKSAWL